MCLLWWSCLFLLTLLHPPLSITAPTILYAGQGWHSFVMSVGREANFTIHATLPCLLRLLCLTCESEDDDGLDVLLDDRFAGRTGTPKDRNANSPSASIADNLDEAWTCDDFSRAKFKLVSGKTHKVSIQGPRPPSNDTHIKVALRVDQIVALPRSEQRSSASTNAEYTFLTGQPLLFIQAVDLCRQLGLDLAAIPIEPSHLLPALINQGIDCLGFNQAVWIRVPSLHKEHQNVTEYSGCGRMLTYPGINTWHPIKCDGLAFALCHKPTIQRPT